MSGQVHESTHPLIQHKLALLRSVGTGAKKFRELVREMAILLAYEATADLGLQEVDVTTPLGEAKGKQVCVYNDPTISYSGRVTGGLRIKKVAPGQQAASYPAPNSTEVPF